MAEGFNLLGFGSDAKTVKGEKEGWLTFILYLAPSTVSIPHGGRDVCPHASKGCAASCLFTAGRGMFPQVRNARIRKTVRYFQDREAFLLDLHKDIEHAVSYAQKRGMKPCFRLNGTSDINWSRMVATYEHLQFYDYTKNGNLVLGNDLPNYHLTFSRSEENEAEALLLMAQGHNVAVVFPDKNFPEHWNGVPVINGDVNDLRFLDPKGCVVGLRAKGQAKKDMTGFVVRSGPVAQPTKVLEPVFAAG